MSCGPVPTTFRLLDPYVGWDADSNLTKDLDGLSDLDGLRLRWASGASGAVAAADLWAYFPPPFLSGGCGCDYYLVTQAPKPSLRWRGPCPDPKTGCWVPVADLGRCGTALRDPVAVAGRGHWVAVADRGVGEVRVLRAGSFRARTVVAVSGPGPIALTPAGEIWVALAGTAQLLRFGVAGDLRAQATAPGPVVRLAVSEDRAVWVVTQDADVYQIFRAGEGQGTFVQVGLADVAKTLPRTALVSLSDTGFCLQERGADDFPQTRCYTLEGCPLEGSQVPAPPPPQRVRQGILQTVALDSGIPRCRWHRVRIDADVPFGTSLLTQVASSETGSPPQDGDWQPAQKALDFLVMQPPGRTLYVRMVFTGDGFQTPLVRRVRLDMPRSTSLDSLPEVFRENPEAEDFTERFLALFDATVADIDRAIERYPALLDSGSVPDEVLPWLGALLDLAFEPAWSPTQRRAILAAAPQLYRLRGTAQGLILAVSLVTGVTPGIEELPQERPYGALGRDSVLRGVRLFGKARARFRVGRSALGQAPLRSFGDPDQDPLNEAAYRFRVLVPVGSLTGARAQDQLQRLVDSQKPAHTVATVRMGGAFLTGTSAIGVDTAFGSLPRPILGGPAGNVRLRRMSVLWSGPGGPAHGLVVGATGIGTRPVTE